ncbi:MAG: branched-chain amino acid ABC transporter ATP-binding protein/permease [Chloroflexota bacterium]
MTLARGLGGFALLFVVLALLPTVREPFGVSVSYLVFLGLAWFWVAQATSWNILSGYSGYFSFGQGAFLAVGAYTTAVLYGRHGVDFFLTIPMAGLLSLLLAFAIGALAFRLRSLRGEIFALLTLAVPFVLESVALINTAIDGGQGIIIALPDYPDALGSFQDLIYRLFLAVGVGSLAIAFAMQHSRLGWALFAIHDAEDVAEGLGVPTFRHKMIAIGLNGLIAGVCGSIFALQIGFVAVQSVFGLTVPLFVIVMSVLGGRSHWLGPLLGAVVIFTLQDRLSASGFEGWSLVILGTILAGLVIVAPEGLHARLRRRPWPVVAAFAAPIVLLAVLGVWGGPLDWVLAGMAAGALVAIVPSTRRRRIDPDAALGIAPESAVVSPLDLAPVAPAAPVASVVHRATTSETPAGGGSEVVVAELAASLEAEPVRPGPVIECFEVTKQFGGVHALQGVSLAVLPGEIVGLVGPNGSGKTTLVGVLSGFLRPTSGDVRVGDASVVGLPPHRIAHLGVARTYQIPRPFASMTIRDNVAMSLMFGRSGESLEAARAGAAEHLEFVGLAGRADARPSEINLHERQLLEMARALAQRPRVLFLDEALAGLNPVEIDNAVGVVRRIHESGVAIVVVEHLLRVVNQLATRLVVLEQGRTLAQGDPGVVMRDPAVVRAYLGTAADA